MVGNLTFSILIEVLGEVHFASQYLLIDAHRLLITERWLPNNHLIYKHLHPILILGEVFLLLPQESTNQQVCHALYLTIPLVQCILEYHIRCMCGHQARLSTIMQRRCVLMMLNSNDLSESKIGELAISIPTQKNVLWFLRYHHHHLTTTTLLFVPHYYYQIPMYNILAMYVFEGSSYLCSIELRLLISKLPGTS